MQTIILEDFGVFLGKKGERFVVKKDRKSVAEFPASEVERIIISSIGASVSSAALFLATENRVPVSFTYSSGRPFAFLTPTSGHGTVLTRRAQYQHATDNRAMILVRGFVLGKMLNQMHLLKTWGKSRSRTNLTTSKDLFQLSENVDEMISRLRVIEGELTSKTRQEFMNVEGLAATYYWSGVHSILPDVFGFTGRVTRGASDLFNMCLNYGYGLLYSEVWSAVTKAGLDPFAGFLHVDRPGRPSLVLDLIEEFRQQIVDRTLVTLAVRSSLGGVEESNPPQLEKTTRESIASSIIKRLSESISYNGKNTSIKNVIQRQAWNVSKILKGEMTRYEPFVLKW